MKDVSDTEAPKLPGKAGTQVRSLREFLVIAKGAGHRLFKNPFISNSVTVIMPDANVLKN